MKKITKLLIIALILYSTLLQTIYGQTEYKLDSIQNFNWNETVMALQMTIRQHYTYDDEGASPTNHLHMLKTNGIWVNNQQTNTTHNNLGLPLVSTVQTWDTIEWKDYFKSLFTYTAFNAFETITNQSWDIITNSWKNSIKDDFLYNDSQLETKHITYMSDNNQDIWIPNYEFETLYDEENRTLGYIQRNYDNTLMQMVNDTQIVNTIINGVLTERLQQEWDIFTNQWLNSSNSELVYNNDLLIQTNDFTWDVDTWEPARQLNYTYNGNGQIETSTTLYYFDPIFQNYSRYLITYTNNHVTEFLFQSWDIGMDDWRNTQKWNDVYDANDNLIESYRYNWDISNTVWKENTKALYFYSEVIPFNLNNNSKELLSTKIFPNPASEVINIKSLSSIKTIEMVDMSGKLLLSTNQSKIKIDGFQKGLYLLNIETDKGKITKRIVIK